jgi:transposase-like protein
VSDQPQRAFSTEFKERLVQRIEAGERLAAVAEEMGVRRKLLYEWRAAYRALGAAGLNRKRGRKPGWKARAGSSPGRASPDTPSGPDGAPAAARPGDELAQAKARIGELERVIGRQQVDLDFFQRALRLMDATPPSAIAPTSTRSSKR